MQQTNCTVTVDIKLLHEALSKLLTSTKTTIDIETSGLNFLKDKIMGIGFALDKENSYYIPLHKYENDKIVSFLGYFCFSIITIFFKWYNIGIFDI